MRAVMNRFNRRDRFDAVSAICLFAASLLVYGRTLAPSLTWQHDGADGGDLIAAAVNLGVPHPSGYPTYILFARLFLLLPLGDEASRLNLMSACFASAAVALFYLFTRATASRWAAALGALLLAFAPLVWSQAVISEVYTLHLFLMVALYWIAQRWQASRHLSLAFCLGLLSGLGLGNHLTFVLALSSLMILMLSSMKRDDTRLDGRVIVVMLIGLLLGLSVYLYLPLASAFGTQFNWGRIDSLEAFALHVSGQIYRGYLFALPLAEWPRRLLALLGMFLGAFQFWGAALVVVGAIRSFKSNRLWLLPLLWLALSSIVFAVGYNTADSLWYLLPLWFACAWWFALGLDASFKAFAGRQTNRFAATALALVVLIALVASAAWRLPALDLSGDLEPEQFASRALASLPAQAILISESDRRTFALWYYTQVRHWRPDVIVIDRDLFVYRPYRAELQRRYAELLIGDETLDTFLSAQRAAHAIYLLDAQGQVRTLVGEAVYAAR